MPATARGAAVRDIGGVPVADLIAQLHAGDHRAVTTLYTALYPSLWRLAMVRTRSADIAKELVHETFLALWMRRTAIDAGTDLAVYLAVAVRNRTRDFRAHEDVVATADGAILSGAVRNPALGEPTPRPDIETERADFRTAYELALTALDDREREAVLLRWDEGYTLERVGQVLGISKMGAHKIVARAQAKVQRLLAAYDPRR